MIILGIDPGIYGGIAHIAAATDENGQYYPIDKFSIKYYTMPIVEYKPKRFELNLSALVELLETYRPKKRDRSNILAVIEAPPKVPGNGVLSTASLFKGYGEIRGVLTTLGISIHAVDPKAWKNKVLEGTDRDKAAAVEYVTKQLGVEIPMFIHKPRTPHDGIADAICIAKYGYDLKVNGNG